MTYDIKISAGEFYDKLSILKIKLEKIKDSQSQEWISKEYNYLLSLADFKDDNLNELYNVLYYINTTLWDLENNVRRLEKQKNFGDEFVKCARNIYKFNDQRALTKKKINILYNSELMEIKEHN